MTTPDTTLLHRFSGLLAEREEELLRYLRATTGEAVASGDAPVEMRDFKDIAAEDSRAAIDAAAADQAARDLSAIHAAQRRVEDGTYGICLDCGDPIEERRLAALPATLYCCACQSVHEKPRAMRR